MVIGVAAELNVGGFGRGRYRVAVMLPPDRGASKLPVYEPLEKFTKPKAEKTVKPPACANVDTKSSAGGAHRGDAHHIMLPTCLSLLMLL